MNKKEQAYVAELEQRLRIQGALRWTEKVHHDLPVPGYGEKTSGFYANTYNGEVRPAWSEMNAHATGYKSREEMGRSSASQRGIPLYSTRLRALRGLRNALELEAAQRLAAVDVLIEKEERIEKEST